MRRLFAKITFISLLSSSIITACFLVSHIIHGEAYLVSLLILSIFLILSVFNFITLFPIGSNTKEIELRGVFPFVENQSDVLLLINSGAIKNKINKGSFDYSLSWINLLNKECGYFSVIDFKDRKAQDLKKRRAVIITNSVLDSIEQKDIDLFKDFASDGGLLCLELPNNALSSLTGCVLTGSFNKGFSITKVAGPSHVEEALKSMPLFFNLQEIEKTDSNVEAMLSIDGKPAICKNSFNKGKVISIFFDLGRQITILRQGFSCAPAGEKRSKKANFLQIRDIISDIIVDNKLSDNDLPFADILEAFVFNIIACGSLAASWWYYPQMQKSALLLTHDEDYYADKCLQVSDYERMLNINSTFFVLSDSAISRSALEAIAKNGTEIGMHWNRFSLHIDSHGMHRNRLTNLKEQLGRLNGLNPHQEVRVNRIHWLKIDSDPLRAFRVLAACGMQADSTFGPHSKEKGYIFGTGFPFYILDNNGGIIKLVEFPFQVQDRRNNASAGYVEGLIKESIAKWHTSIVMLYHPHHFGKNNSIWNDWSYLLQLMKDKDIWQVNFKDYLSFVDERKQSCIKTSFDEQNNILSIYIEPKGDKSLRIPLANDRLRLKRISAAGRHTEFKEMDGYAFFPVYEGQREFSAQYG
jgi:hypothetical protein